jgi:hypothetical protein
MWLFATLRGRLVLIVLVAAVMFGGRWLFGHADGEACSDAFLCKALPARCVRSTSGAFCSRPCKSDPDCAAGWRCGDVLRDQNGTLIGVETACLKPGAVGPFSVPVRR